MSVSLAATLAFEPPDWPIFLAGVAMVLLGWEVSLLLRRIWRGRTTIAALCMTVAAFAAGPILAASGLLYGVMTAATGGKPRGREIVLVGVWGTLLVLLGGAVWSRPSVGGIVAIATVACLWVSRAYRRTTSPLEPGTKAWLFALRLAVIVLLGCWSLRPVLQRTHLETVRSVLLIALDCSSSMQRRDMPPNYQNAALSPDQNPIRRIDAIRQALSGEADAIDTLSERADLEWFAFDQTPVTSHPLQDKKKPWALLLESPPGPATAIGDCLQGVFDPISAAGRDVTAIVLLSDGCNNTSAVIGPEKFAARMATRDVPVHTVGVGSEKVTSKMHALTVRTPGAARTVNAFSRMSIKPVIDAIGLPGRTVKVTCRFGDTLVDTMTRKINTPRSAETFEFTHVPLDAGFHRLTISAELLGEPAAGLVGKPIADMLVQVTDREIRLLYVEGKFRYETKYIARALGSYERIALDRRILLQPLRPGNDPSLGEKLEDWLRYHAIIFGDVPASQFTTKQLEAIKTVVGEYGKGFCMIGGQESFGRGGWAETPIADILPVDLARSGGNIKTPVQPLPTPEGRESDVMWLGAADEPPDQAWAKLDSMPGANLLEGVKPAATVLGATKKRNPMIVAQNYGKGRTLAIAFDMTWRWVLSPKGDETGQMQKRFWRQVALYLAAPKGNVWIHTNRTTYDLAALERGTQEVEVTGGVEDSRGQPTAQSDVKITLSAPDEKISLVELQPGKTMRRGTLPPPTRPGTYVLTITAQVDGKDLTAEQQFRVVRRDRESGEVLANHALLRRMAQAGNGRFVPLRGLPDLLKTLRREISPQKRRVTTTQDLLGPLRWVILLLIIALLCGEWVLRKKKGLV